jgi:hypothetical protein
LSATNADDPGAKKENCTRFYTVHKNGAAECPAHQNRQERSLDMPLIETTELKALVDASDNAHQELIQASEAWLDVQARLFRMPADPADEVAEVFAKEAVNKARAAHTYAMGVVVAELRNAIFKAEQGAW